MTINSPLAKIGPTEGNASGTTFSSSPIVFYDTDDIQVVHTDSAGVDTNLVVGTSATNYSIAFVSADSIPSVVTVTYPAAGSGGSALPVGEFITIKRVVPLLQEVDLENQGGYYPDTQEQALDELTMMVIQQQDDIDRALKAPVSDDLSGVDLNLPTVTERAGKLLGFNAQGEPVATDSGVDSSLTTTFTENFLLSDDAQSAMQVLAPSSVLDLYNPNATEATSPNDLEYTSQLLFKADNDMSEETIFSAIRGQIGDETDGTEDGRILFSWMFNGTENYYFKMGSGPIAQLLSYGEDALANPKFQLLRKSQSAADGDLGGQIVWQQNHDGSATITGPVDIAYIQVQFDDVSETSEDAHLEVVQKVAGSDVEVLSTTGANLTVTNDLIAARVFDGSSQIHSVQDGLAAPQTAPASAAPIEFTGIRSDARRITVMFNGLSTDGSEEIIIQIGDSGGYETASYISNVSAIRGTSAQEIPITSGFAVVDVGVSTDSYTGAVTLTLMNSSTNYWVVSGNLVIIASGVTTGNLHISGGRALDSVLTQLRITTTGTPDDWDAGSVNILVE